MSAVELIATIAAAIQIMVLAVLLPLSVKLAGRKGGSLTAVFLAFCYALWLFTDLYWLIYDIARPDSRMPFAANEIGEAAVFLMMAAMLGAACGQSTFRLSLQALAALVFGGCNVVLWIAWSGEWVEDILVGLIFMYLLYSIVVSLKSEEALKAGEWIFTGLLCLLLLLSQSLTLLTEEPLKSVADSAGYFLLVLGSVFWAFHGIRSMKKKAAPKMQLVLACAALGWMITSKYMSAGGWYNAFLLLEDLGLPLMYLAVRKVVEEA